jgi:hypothetical protein
MKLNERKIKKRVLNHKFNAQFGCTPLTYIENIIDQTIRECSKEIKGKEEERC